MMGALRIFLALSVALWHVPNHSVSGVDAGVAVLLFFIMSGFYMALVINERYAKNDEPFWKRQFYAARFFRLFPAYLAMVAFFLTAMALSPRRHMAFSEMGQPWPSGLLIVVMNAAIVGQDLFQTFVNSVNYQEANRVTGLAVAAMPAGFFDNSFMMVGQAWSLASELLFYALAPFVVRSPRRILGLLVLSVALRWTLIFGLGFSSEVWGYNFFPDTLCLFLLGCLSYHLYARVGARTAAKNIGLMVGAAIVTFSLWSIWRYGGVLLIDRSTGYDTARLWTAYVAFALALPFLFACSRTNRLDRLIGELSYPLYLSHGAVLGIIFGHLHRDGGDPLWEIGAAAISLATAFAMFRLIDRPIDAWRHRKYAPTPLTEVPAPAR